MKPPALDYSVENCTVGRAMAVLGERWTFVVLREVFNGVRRFDDMRAHTDVPRQVLANRLALLVGEGILRREPYREPGARLRHEYRLTDKGFDLYPVLVAVLEWGDRYLSDPEGSPVEIAHRDCGSRVVVRLSCEDGHAELKPREVAPRPGPGARHVSAELKPREVVPRPGPGAKHVSAELKPREVVPRPGRGAKHVSIAG